MNNIRSVQKLEIQKRLPVEHVHWIFFGPLDLGNPEWPQKLQDPPVRIIGAFELKMKHKIVMIFGSRSKFLS